MSIHKSDAWRVKAMKRIGMLAAIAVVVPMIGCGKRVETGALSGTVTYKGKPLEFGSVLLQPAEGGPASYGTIGPDGSFTAAMDGKSGVPIGVNKVLVTCYTSQRPGASSGGGEKSVGDSLIPEHYTRFSSSGLKVEVKPGDNPPYNIQLTD